jgi:hypothetical protein
MRSRSDERLPSHRRGARIHDPEHSRSPPKRRLLVAVGRATLRQFVREILRMD